jgi:Gas vesicle synthesis protein GvpL/GvpF
VSAEAAPREDGPGWYLYGVVAADAAIDGVPDVRLVEEGSLAGVTSQVSLAEFDPSVLPERLGDAVWLEEKIRAHEQVLEGVLETASVVPCRFCTIYHTEEELRRFLSDRGDDLAAALSRVDGRVELGVKAFVDRDRFASGGAVRNETIRELAEHASQVEGGRAYLEMRRLEQLVTEELMRFREEVSVGLHERLMTVSHDGVLLNLQRPEVTGRDEEMVFNAAYLVADSPRFGQTLRELADEHRESGVELELTGPWPPYNFVPVELGAV